ncbi:MAG: LysM peptidoglycan-binding domain-containing protein [Nevskiales bacterium]|nr:LysM peptidoglycan-binding domain-containing protein [Nevskiales bacterium]
MTTYTGEPAAEDPPPFPRSSLLQPSVAVWTRVFAEFSEFQSVIHSMDQPEKIYVVLDFRDDAAQRGIAEARRLQAKGEQRAKQELDQKLKRVHQLRYALDQLAPDERAVYALFEDDPDPNRYKKAVGRFRAQRGLRESTERALQTSGLYLSKMETIFAAESLPVLLTRLPLVESSFNVEARSKAGAVGLWQFMPTSARLYMRVDEAVDERRDPWNSTQGAALHLKNDYEALGDWPLAVTAYNYGRSGLTRALREVNGETLDDLLQNWNGRRFGFASRNFYAEFLAAVDVERNHHNYFAGLERQSLLEFEELHTEHYVSYETLQRCAGVDESLFRQLNPGFRPEVLDGRLHVPPQVAIRVPVEYAEPFKTAYEALTADERFDQQSFYYVRYRVQNGDTLGGIAHRYGVSLSSLQQANGIRDPRLLRIGQVLHIPPRSGKRTLTATASDDSRQREINGIQYLLHRVQPGQTLSTIARQYQTTIAVLKQLNRLDESQLLYAGATLKVPLH